MSAHTESKVPCQRIPLTLYGSDILLLLRLKHKLESEGKRPVQFVEIFRDALRDLAIKHDIIVAD